MNECMNQSITQVELRSENTNLHQRYVNLSRCVRHVAALHGAVKSIRYRRLPFSEQPLRILTRNSTHVLTVHTDINRPSGI